MAAEFSAGDRFVVAAYALRAGDTAAAQHAIDVLATAPLHEVAAEIGGMLEAQTAHLWNHGWQPADLACCVDRDLGATGAEILRRVIASEALGYEELGARVAPDWMAQLERIGATCSRRASFSRRPPPKAFSPLLSPTKPFAGAPSRSVER